MRDRVVKCTNCGLIAAREHILPLCNDCFIGLEDYEEFLAKSARNVEIFIYNKPAKVDNFLKL